MKSKSISIKDITGLAKKETIPVSVLIEVNYSCNENCIHCCVNNHDVHGLTLEDYNRLFQQLADSGTLFIILTGGEPFLRPDFIKIISLARKHYLSVTIFSNGTLINDKIIKQLKNLFVHEVHVSLYAMNEKIHEQITRTPGSYQKTISSIKRLITAGINTKIKCPLMELNISEKDNIKKFASDLGIEVQFTTTITAKNNGDRSTHRLRLSAKSLRFALSDNKIEKGTSNIKTIEKYSRCIPCDVVFNGGAIDPFGNVFACNQLRIIGGNILEEHFSMIWKHSVNFVALRKITLNDLHKCKSCEVFSYCTRCPGLALLEDNDLFGCSSTARFTAFIRKDLGIYPLARHIFSKQNAKKEVTDEKQKDAIIQKAKTLEVQNQTNK